MGGSKASVPGDFQLADAKHYLQTGTSLSPAAVTAATTPAAAQPPALKVTGSHKSHTESAKHGAGTPAAKPGKPARPASNAGRSQAGTADTPSASPPATKRPSPVQSGAAKQAGAGSRREPGSSLDSGLINQSAGQQANSRDDVHVPGNMPVGGSSEQQQHQNAAPGTRFVPDRAAQHPGLGLLRGSAAIKAGHSTQMGSPDGVPHSDTAHGHSSPKLTGITPRAVVPVKQPGHPTTSSGLQSASSLASRNSGSPSSSKEAFAPQLRRGLGLAGSKGPSQKAASASLRSAAKPDQSGRQNLFMSNTFGILEDHVASDEDQEDNIDDQFSYGLGFESEASDAATAAAFQFQTGTASSTRGWGTFAGPPASHPSADIDVDDGLWQQVDKKGKAKLKMSEPKQTAQAGALQSLKPPHIPDQSSAQPQWDVRQAHFPFRHHQIHSPRPADSMQKSHSQQQGFEPVISSLSSFAGNRNSRKGSQVHPFYQGQGAPSAPSAVVQRGHIAGAQAQSSLLATNTDQLGLHSSHQSSVQLDPALRGLCCFLGEDTYAALHLEKDTGMYFTMSAGQALVVPSLTVTVSSLTMIALSITCLPPSPTT